MKEYYRINEVAGLYGLCADTLRHYEEQGLLSPRRADNQYRLYGIQEICTLNIIQNLRSLDVPLPRIRDYLATRTADSTLALLAEESALIDKRIAALQALWHSVQRRAAHLTAARELPAGQPYFLDLPGRPCYRLSEGITLEKDVDYLLKKLEQKHAARLRSLGDRQMGATLDAACFEKGIYTRYANAFYICEDIADYDVLIPGGTYACIVYAGAYGNLGQALPELLDFITRQGHVSLGAPMELYHIDIHDTNLPEEFLTEVQIPVAPKKG